MVTKTKEPVTEEPTEPEAKTEESEPVTKANLRSLLEELIPEFLRGEPEAEADPEKPAKRETAKDEEQRTYADVMEAIKEFKASLKSEPKEEKTAEPETVPGSTTVRKIEKLLWGAE
jgi:hypothetical protein